jgi:hypothetical protein
MRYHENDKRRGCDSHNDRGAENHILYQQNQHQRERRESALKKVVSPSASDFPVDQPPAQYDASYRPSLPEPRALHIHYMTCVGLLHQWTHPMTRAAEQRRLTATE